MKAVKKSQCKSGCPKTKARIIVERARKAGRKFQLVQAARYRKSPKGLKCLQVRGSGGVFVAVLSGKKIRWVKKQYSLGQERVLVWKGRLNQTRTGQKKSDLVLVVKNGVKHIRNKKRSALSKFNPWAIAMKKAHAALKRKNPRYMAQYAKAHQGKMLVPKKAGNKEQRELLALIRSFHMAKPKRAVSAPVRRRSKSAPKRRASAPVLKRKSVSKKPKRKAAPKRKVVKRKSASKKPVRKSVRARKAPRRLSP
jgi:hypothetical protein